ncbi:PAS domain-containing protein [Algibacter sp. AS12]|uniref:PAS domain-containing protein n=1 Tax=Algibacter sp. AS12 TaxID=3135773 RepID=UPI00398AE4D3
MQAIKHYMWRTNPEIAISEFIKSNVAVSVSDKLGRIVYANDRFCTITESKESELLGVVNRLFVSDIRKDPFYKELWKTIENGQVWKGILSSKTKTGKQFELESTIVPTKDNDGNIESFVSMYLDVSNKVECQ